MREKFLIKNKDDILNGKISYLISSKIILMDDINFYILNPDLLGFEELYYLSKITYDLRMYTQNIKICNILISESGIINLKLQNIDYLIPEIWHLLGMSHFMNENYYESLYSIKKSIEHLNLAIRFKERIFDSIAQIYSKVGKIQDAEYFFLNSIKIKWKIKDLLGLSMSFGGLAKNFLLKSEYKKAITCIKILSLLSRKNDNIFGIFLSNIYFIECYNQYHEEIILSNRKSLGFEQIENKLAEYSKNAILSNENYLNKSYFHDNISPLRTNYLLEVERYHILSRNHNDDTNLLMSNEKITELNESQKIKKSLNRVLLNIKKNQISESGKIMEELILKAEEENRYFDQIQLLNILGKIYYSIDEIKLSEKELIQSIELSDRLNLEEISKKNELFLKSISEISWIKLKLKRYFGSDISSEILNEYNTNKIINATVSFCDMRNFTSLSESIANETLIDVLNQYFTHMNNIIFEKDGYVDKYIGDAILYIHKKNKNNRSAAGNSIFTAIKMSSEVNIINLKLNSIGLPSINIGIGIHSGSLFSGFIGPISRREYTVIGDTVNIASRLEGITKIYGLQYLFSEDSLNSLNTRELETLKILFIDEIILKGKSKSTKIFYAIEKKELTKESKKNIKYIERGIYLFRNNKFKDSVYYFSLVDNKLFEKLKEVYLDKIKKLQDKDLDQNFFITKLDYK
jgi:class 3 adenylate cyclase